ncbi:septation protein SepH [Arcanobacterium canis]|uniref:Septation protein SepH n=1 Tax=Arcanobacterium canis TaxID=999183 RepID=A0ABY8G0L4_9ACTO|nr:septation protein SepH [Arcanobacterium canis]WFM82706.1 septation protein SepH [Arcanobacterium canis]
MIDLELLGVVTDGDALSLNDAEGNRYRLPITPQLRAALRKDIRPENGEQPRPITPKEIQAHFRAGLSVAEVSEITSIPPSDLDGLARPILAERQYTALQARRWMLSKEDGSMSLEELVGSRLAARSVTSESILWDSYKKNNERFLSVEFTIGEKQHAALWKIDMKAHTVVAANDEATWLTETQIPAPTSPWRPLNTPQMSENTASLEARRARHIAEDPHEPITPDDASDESASIADMLDSLDSQRGVSRPMPDFDGAHPAASDVEGATDATILAFPSRSDSEESAATANEARLEIVQNEDEQQEEIAEIPPSPQASTKDSKKRKGRPSMPSWDEIVFGYSKDD